MIVCLQRIFEIFVRNNNKERKKRMNVYNNNIKYQEMKCITKVYTYNYTYVSHRYLVILKKSNLPIKYKMKNKKIIE